MLNMTHFHVSKACFAYNYSQMLDILGATWCNCRPPAGHLLAACWLPAAQSVLAVKHNEIDEGNNLTDVGHSTTDVDGAKCFWDALEHIHGDAESACLALVHIHGLVDGKSHVCDVGCHHAHIHTTLHTVADWTFSDQQTSAIPDGLITQDADLRGGQLWRSSGTCGRTQRSSSCNLPQS
jgi:hypothetical protein